MAAGRFKPGQKCPQSGQWRVVGTKREVTVVKGEPFPPIKGGGVYVLADKTKHSRRNPPRN